MSKQNSLVVRKWQGELRKIFQDSEIFPKDFSVMTRTLGGQEFLPAAVAKYIRDFMDLGSWSQWNLWIVWTFEIPKYELRWTFALNI